MGKLDKLQSETKGNAQESLGKNRPRVDLPAAAIQGPAPARLQGVTRATDSVRIEVDRIEPDPDQPREEFDREALERLAGSLKSKGQLQPVRVRWVPERGCYEIIAGERRWRAAKLAGMTTVSATIQEGEVTARERLVLQLVENCIREDLRPLEQARAFRTLMDQNGWTTRQVADELSVSQTVVAQTLKLLTLPEPVQARVEQGELPPATAYEVSKFDDPVEQAVVAEKAVAEKLTRDDVRDLRNSRKAGREGGSSSHGSSKIPCDDYTVVVSGPPPIDSPETLERVLLEAIRRVKSRPEG